LFNIPSARAIQNASVRDQCAKDYLYGKDGHVEAALARLEGDYSTIIKRLSDGETLNEAALKLLRFVVFVQARRTEAAIKLAQTAESKFSDEVFARDLEQRPPATPESQLMRQSLKMSVDGMRYVEDLKAVIIVNETKRDFVTSDNPALLTNKFHFQRLRQDSFGYGNSGAMLVMPVTPNHLFLGYDTGVYTIPELAGGKQIAIRKVEDVDALNELAYLSASSNVYFRDWNNRALIARCIESVATRRAAEAHRIFTLVRDESHDDVEVYREGTLEEQRTARETIVGHIFVHRQPSSWLSALKYRSKPVAYNTGTAAGHVRKKEWGQRASNSPSPQYLGVIPKK